MTKLGRMTRLTAASEDYVKAVWTLSRKGGVTTSALAAELAVAPASATAMLKKLAKLKLVDHEPYRGVTLTPAGERVALEIVRHHRLVERFLVEALGVPWDEVHQEADRWEHVLSEELEQRMDAALGFPTTDPHGYPIPDAKLRIPPTDFTPLAQDDVFTYIEGFYNGQRRHSTLAYLSPVAFERQWTATRATPSATSRPS